MKKNNLLVSILIIIIAIVLGVYLMHRQVTAPVTSTAPSSISQGDTSDDGSSVGDSDSSGDDSTPSDKSFVLACDDQKMMNVTFHLPADTSVDVALDDGSTFTLANTSTASQTSYANADGSVALNFSDTGATLVQNGTATYSNCAPQQTDGSATGGTDDSSGTADGSTTGQ